MRYADLLEASNHKGTFDPSSKRFDEKALSSTFSSWFGKSVVVDDQGAPLVLYHGTGADINNFKGMVWASVTPNLANMYADLRHDMGGSGNVMPVYLRIERPFDADRLPKTVSVGVFFTEAARQAREAGRNFSNSEAAELVRIVKEAAREESSGPHYDRHDFWFETYSFFGRAGADAIHRLFAMFGFDGVMMTEKGEMTFGAFSQSQVKSAIGNRGTFTQDSDVLTDAVDNTAFSRWFKNSKVVDSSGKPLVVYHGTFGSGADDEDDEDASADGLGYRRFDDVRSRGGFWFTERPDYANDFTHGKRGEVYPVYLSVQNPMNVGLWDIEDPSEELISKAINSGHDGLYYHGPHDKSNGGQWFVFRPEQIKSAIGNRGTFNLDSASLTERGEPRYFTVGELRERGSRALDEWEDAGYPTRDDHRLMMGANQCRVQRQVFGNDQTLDEAEKPLKKRSLTPKEKAEVKIDPSRLECSIAYFDGKGYAAYTHRARSKFYKKAGDIPKKTLEFISSTS